MVRTRGANTGGRRTRSRHTEEGVVIEINQKLAVSRHLSSTHFDLLNAAGMDEVCSICLESVMNCRRCYCLLSCGHSLHAGCFLQLKDASVCPVCRTGASNSESDSD